MNEFNLHTGFRELFGQAPHEFFNEVRFERAKELLLEGIPVGVVAVELDYVSANPFIAKFKAKFGCTPKEFQKRGG